MLSYREITDDVLAPLSGRPRQSYLIVLSGLALVVAWAMFCWLYQVKTGMGVSGLNIPVAWATYITNFVFWIGIGHAGTLISAILFLVRSRWRTAISRSAEAMTVFAVLTAALFPLIHLGRVWVFFFTIPYPSQRQLWPTFFSPLVWDVVAVTTYLTVSTIFWLVGLIPDLATARDRTTLIAGPDHPRSRWYRRLSLGWSGSGQQWRHHGRGYLFFAALATPLVISVHSVVSWDFAVSLLPGWHTTIFAPYFVAGAIHSGLAMVLVLLIPMRKILRLDRLIRIEHFDAAAQLMLFTGIIVGYTYIVEPFIAWYSTDHFEIQFAHWRATGWLAWGYWLLPVLNVLAPLAFIFSRARRSIFWLLLVSVLVNIGMWLERLVIIVGSTAHDFLPHNWDRYAPSWVELSITLGSFGFFLFLFLLFAKVAPTIAISDVKEDLSEGPQRYIELDPAKGKPPKRVPRNGSGVLGVFDDGANLVHAVEELKSSPFDAYEIYSPVRLREAESAMSRGRSPIRFWTLTGAILGVTGGFSLAIGTGLVNDLVVGAKQPHFIIPFFIIGFEGLILIGSLFNFFALLGYSGLGRTPLPPWYDRRFSDDRFGVFVSCRPEQFEQASSLLQHSKPEEVRHVP